MTDLVDYVLNAMPELALHPRWGELDNALSVEVLGYADECVQYFRDHDRLADAMADPRWESYTGIEINRHALRAGMRIIVDGQTRVIHHVKADYYNRIDVWLMNEATNWLATVGHNVPIWRWVPLPIDGATLGERPSTSVAT
jgi:hypothetical protein